MKRPPLGLKAFLGLYGLLWRGARPLLRRHKRLRDNFDERLAPPSWAPPEPVDIWIQAASGGEAFLARQLLGELGRMAEGRENAGCPRQPGAMPEAGPPARSPMDAALPHPRASGHSGLPQAAGFAALPVQAVPPQAALRLLCTSCTRQGLDTLTAAAAWAGVAFPSLGVTVRPFPLDEPELMRRALEYARPRLLVLLETELWPGLMAACALRGVPVGVVNGRMTKKSLDGYRLIRPFWRRTAPRTILATSDDDAARFATLFGSGRATTMPNMKFDAFSLPEIAPPLTREPEFPVKGAQPDTGAVFVKTLLPEQLPVLLLASVREQEETILAGVIAELRRNVPEAAVVVAPRHMERAGAWGERLAALPGDGRVLRRTALETRAVAARSGDVVIWDAFGELRLLYDRAQAVFVGGSLAPLGGQNFLEAAFAGLIPGVGPYWSNFAWVGEAFFDQGLAVRIKDASALPAFFAGQLRRPVNRAAVRARVAAYVAPRQGGSRTAARCVADLIGFGGGDVAGRKSAVRRLC